MEKNKKNNIQINNNATINSYVVVRVLLTLLVVVGHCSYYSIISEYGGIDWSGEMSKMGIPDTRVHMLTSFITSIIYTFHMPMFISLSGALFEYRYKSNSFDIIKKRAKKLLIPFLTVTTFVSVPLKYIARYWDGSTNALKDIIVGQYLIQGNTHLWFLPTLFLEIVFFSVILKIEKKNRVASIILIFVGLIGSVFYSYIPIEIISNFVHYFLWFYLGILFERKRVAWDRYFNKLTMILFFVLWSGSMLGKHILAKNLLSPAITNVLSLIITFAVTLFGILFFYSLCNCVSKTRIINSKIIQMLNKHSFGIYLYSDGFNYVILEAFVCIFSVSAFGNDIAALLLYASRIIITLIISILITVVIRKVKSIKKPSYPALSN